MCGIFGLWHTDGAALDLEQVVRITQSLRHRGPDDEGYFLADTNTRQSAFCAGRDTQPGLDLPAIQACAGRGFNFALGFRRLSILDLSPLGHQPMSRPDGRYTLVLNGEIYNYLELREELTQAGHAFRSQSDSEVLLAAYAEWGHNALPKLVGMFAFAIFDLKGPSLFLARDFCGIKPMYLARRRDRFAFASEIPALLRLPWVGRRVHPQRVYDYLRFGLTDDGSRTMFADVEQVPAAHAFEVRADEPLHALPKPYWHIDLARRTDISFDEAASRLERLFAENVWLHLRSDVPVGACLSGGIDSSAVVMAMRRLAPDSEIHVFSYCADDSEFGEERWVDLVGREARAVVHKVRLDAPNLADDLTNLIHSQGEPFGSTSIYAQHRVFRLAREAGVKVMLDGQGADELLAGYRPYFAARIASLLKRGRCIEAWRLFRSCAALPGMKSGALLRETGGLLMPSALQDAARTVIRKPRVPAWLNRSWFEQRGVRFDLLWASRDREVLREKLWEAFAHTSLPMLLRFEDRNSMAHSIESRVPFLTPALAQFLFSLPEEYLIARDGTSKAVFRAAMRDVVPNAVLDRRDKIGFATPERDWLVRLRPWGDEILAGEAAPPVLRIDRIREEWQAVLAGHGRFDFRVWRWINMIVWAQQFDVSFEGS